MSLLEVIDLQTEVRTRDGVVRPVDGVSFTVEPGETVGLVGESGSGKTMTGMSLLRLLPPGGSVTGGQVLLEGRDLTRVSEHELRRLRGNEIAMVFQDPMTSLNPTRTIGSQLREAYSIHRGGGRAAATRRAQEVLGLVGMPRPAERLDDYPHQLSGGMRQRAMIAVALVCEPKLLIADEPTTALDVSIQAQILALLDTLKAQLGMGVLLVTHDLGVIAGHTDRVLVMYAGRVVERASTSELFASARHRYTRALLESMPTFDLDRRRSLTSIPGIPPKLSGLPPMCRFAPRCRFAEDDCRSDDPVLAPAIAPAIAPALALAAVGDEHAHACFHPAAPGDRAALPAVRDQADRRRDGGAPPLLELVDVHRTFPLRRAGLLGSARRLHAVSGVSLAVRPGETLGIVGESGCGKTTLGRMLVGLDRPTGGSVRFQGSDLTGGGGAALRRRRRDVQLMFQDSAAALDPRMTVAALVEEPLVAQRVGTREERRERVAELLRDVGLPEDAGSRYAHEFSGGQRQRVAIARALALRPRVIVADEPVSALDVSIQAQILNLLRGLQDRDDLTYVVISHDLSLLKYLADRIGVMYLGKLVELGPSEQVYAAPRHPYTAGLIRSVPEPDPRRATAAATGLTGELPSAIDPPSGCRFRTRCPLATERCAAEEPVLTPAPGRQAVACHYPLSPGDPFPGQPAATSTART